MSRESTRQRTRLRRWAFVHRWSSLIATAFLLMLCVTGLPLIFHDEIDGLVDPPPPLPPVAAQAGPRPSLDAVIAAVLAGHPGHGVRSIGFSRSAPIAFIQTAPPPGAPADDGHAATIDLRTGRALHRDGGDGAGVMDIVLALHAELFMGLPGSLLLGAIGLTTIAAILSGVVLYAPFMRRLGFATIRRTRRSGLRWLDLHNLIGIVTVVWALAVAATGAINTLHKPIEGAARAELVARMRRYAGSPPATHPGSVDAAIATARAAAPGMAVSSLWYPGTKFSTPHHYVVFLTGSAPITSKLLKPALINAETGRLDHIGAMPWYVTALFLARPLHFGDYGGLPLKVLWALLDLATIAVLASGLHLWLAHRRRPG